MNRNVILAAAALACASIAAAAPPPEKKTEPTAAYPEPRNPVGAFEPPAQSIPQPVAGKPSPLANEGTGRPVMADADLIRGLTASLLDDPSAPAVKGLTISVVGGKATIRGTVASQKDKDVVTAKAGAVAGLRNVTNEIVVAP
jgi:hypothetical protein